MNGLDWITPNWPAPAGVRALSTLRTGGVSVGHYASLNLATHVGDESDAVIRNRESLKASANLPAEPIWLEQVHGNVVCHVTGPVASTPTADACVTRVKQQICTILTADCLPVIFCDLDGTAVGAAHAGWRGLAGGVLSETLREMGCSPERVIAWMGPAIEQSAFEVGDEVREQFIGRAPQHADAFAKNERGRWQADIYALARRELEALNVAGVYGGEFNVYADAERFYSYRRDKQTGRMATMVWIE
jgi:polyphenol oxidase